ncbi:DUF6306 domain-containing protein [Pseudomonas denitrificans (nom. rej.)]|uniref:DUF6306 domain-containing protein n=1 Tax=Pseudomonas denitrificans TaxID=43306 RepID=UPI001E55C621|nr:DUF6306 domain-containing protein [Pseudomonas denitrificans (nom. rej.)]
MSDDLIDWLQTLMRAERAGARVMLDSLRQADEAVARHRLERLHQGEAESCRRLRRCLERLGATPDTGVGDFHASAMAIDDLELRFDFIGRGQRWVAGRSRSACRKSMSPGCAKSWRRCCGYTNERRSGLRPRSVRCRSGQTRSWAKPSRTESAPARDVASAEGGRAESSHNWPAMAGPCPDVVR